MPASSRDAVAIVDLTSLVGGTPQARVYPNEDALLDVLQARFRLELPYIWIRDSTLVAINPFRPLENVNDASKRAYEQSYRNTSNDEDAPPPLQPHVYELANRVYLMMRRRNESQGVVFRGLTGSGKSHTARLLSAQLLRLSAHSRRDAKLADQIRAFETVLESFGHAKTVLNPSASRYSRYSELHFNDKGRIAAAQILAFGLDKSRLVRLSHDERSFHVFYQLLAGATIDERDTWGLEDPSDYALLASSGCYRLPGGPFSDDAINMEDLRASLKILGFKTKHIASIFSLLVVILLLGNLEFADYGTKEITYESARITNLLVLERVCTLLGVDQEAMEQALTNKTNYVRRELHTLVLPAPAAAQQRDRLVQDLYAILFAFVVETANHRVAPPSNSAAAPPFTQIVSLDVPGFQSRSPTGSVSATGPAPLVSAYGHNKFDEFVINFQNELLHSYVVSHTFDNAVGFNAELIADGVAIPAVSTMENAACVELLRGAYQSQQEHQQLGGILNIMSTAASSYRQGKSSDRRDADLLRDLTSRFGVHTSFVRPSPPTAQLFGVNHYSGSCTYEVSGFVEREADLLDSAFVSLLRASENGFVAKLVSGPSLSVETHHNDPDVVVQAQVSSRPLRSPTPLLNSSEADEVKPYELDPHQIYPITTQVNSTLSALLSSSLSRTHLWTVACLRPNDSASPNSFDKRRIKSQIRSLLLTDHVARRSTEYSVGYTLDEFCERYAYSDTVGQPPLERIGAVMEDYGCREGVEYAIGRNQIFLAYATFRQFEDPLRQVEKERRKIARGLGGGDEESVMDGDDAASFVSGWKDAPSRGGATSQLGGGDFGDSSENLNLLDPRGRQQPYAQSPGYAAGGMSMPSPNVGGPFADPDNEPSYGWGSDVEKSGPGGLKSEANDAQSLRRKPSVKGSVKGEPNQEVQEVPTSNTRKWWLRWVWFCTWYLPDFCLTRVGRMKRPDIRLAWREKVTICLMIFFLCAIILFYIIFFGNIICPGQKTVWNEAELGGHSTEDNFYVSIAGEVYDITKFWRGDHSNVPNVPVTNTDMLTLAGLELTHYFPVPLATGCSGFVSDTSLFLTAANFTPDVPLAQHKSGGQAQWDGSLKNQDWYPNTFLETMKQYRKGPLVYSKKTVKKQANEAGRIWSYVNSEIFDLSDYFNTITINNNNDAYKFLPESITDIFQQQVGIDVTKDFETAMAKLDPDTRNKATQCLKNNFYYGRTDFRDAPKCHVANVLLLVFAGILTSTIVIKFLAALQLTPKRNPELLDKFVICQVPCYTEGEESLRRTIDSLASLQYDDKRKLLFLICDGNIIGSGNDRTTPRIVLDILGVDPSLDPEPLLFHSVGEESKQLNYAKCYSGLYEFEGHVVPYVVISKVGKPSERSRPGNRGKRDSQILLMQYLNRVHFDAPMNPLELEIYHQMRNVIGIDPAFYEYIFMVDADTSVTPESLNRLVACCADDSAIIAVCGETKLDNEEGSWWTMIQVYEYYISHHLAKAFESLFGSVTCLPGCFSLYRIRTADKGRPLIISNRVIDDYSVNIVDTLHKKNLLSLGEDRYLTTIMMSHFPTFKMKFTPDAVCHTVAPDRFGVLLSQRRRWINSTVHNLVELVNLPELCGFCLFSMRFFVFLDLIGTLILPATTIYLFYLIITVATGQAPVPIIALVLIGVSYGLQVVIFLLKREFMLIGWLIIYILAFPIYSFFLPVYSFWCMDDFSWGNTRVVVGEGANKKVIVDDEEKYDDSMIPLKRFSDYEAETWETGTQRSGIFANPERSPSRPGSRAQTMPPGTRSASSLGHHQTGGDYYRDTNPLNNGSQSNHRLPNSGSRAPSVAGMSLHGGVPQLPMPFMHTGYAGSQAGSDYGGANPFGYPAQPQFPQQTGMSMGMGMPGYAGSMYGMPPPMAPRNSVMTNLNMFPSGQSMHGGMDGSMMPPNAPFAGGQRPASTFSLNAGAVAAPMPSEPSQSTDPSDEELLNVLQSYLASQDLMTVTKKTAREAVATQFPKADLAPKKDFLNASIDKILST